MAHIYHFYFSYKIYAADTADHALLDTVINGWIQISINSKKYRAVTLIY